MKTKSWLITAAVLFLIGCMLIGGAMMALQFDFSKFSTTKFETNTHTVTDAFRSIALHTDTADLTFAPAPDDQCKVICYEPINEKHSVTIEDGVLTIRTQNTKKWYDYIGIHFITPKITVYLPQSQYQALTIREDTGDITLPEGFTFGSLDIAVSTGDIFCGASVLEQAKIKTSTGKIHLENMSAGTLDLQVSTGDVSVADVACSGDMALRVSTGKAVLTNLTCVNFTTTGNTGDLIMKNVTAAGRFSIARTTGDIRFDRCDATEITVTTDTGDVTGTLLSDKIFFATTDTGHVNVPKSTTGGKCEITTDTGNIKIQLAN